MKLKDLLKQKGLELHKVYTDKDRPPFQVTNEAIGRGMKWEDLKSGTSIEYSGGTTYVVTKIDKNKLDMSLKRRGKTGGGLFAPKAKLDKSQFESQVKVGFIKYLVNTNPRVKEGVNEGIEKSYRAIMDLEKDINKLEQIFNREKSSMVKDRANNMKKSIQNLKMCWNRLYADTQER